MISHISYGVKLDKYVESQDLIPYRLHKNSRYRNNCYYWIDFQEKWFKVEEVLYDFSTPIPILDHVIVVWMDNMQGYLCTDLSIYDYRLERDVMNIRNAEIINSSDSFAGGEIEYWFFKHHVNFITSEYSEFAKFFTFGSSCRIDPNKFYYVKASMINGKYKNVRFILDKTQSKFNQPNKNKKVKKPQQPFNISKEEITYQRRRRRKRHEHRSN